MLLEEELNTQNFQDIQHKTALNILFTAGWLRNRTQSVFKKFGLSTEQFNVLRILRGAHPKALCLKDITKRMVDRNSNTTRIVEKLVGKHLIMRTHSPKDRRALEILITQEGLAELSKIDDALAYETPHRVPNLSDKECELLNQMLEKIRAV